jgi:hypothetical protein
MSRVNSLFQNFQNRNACPGGCVQKTVTKLYATELVLDTLLTLGGGFPRLDYKLSRSKAQSLRPTIETPLYSIKTMLDRCHEP